MMTFHRNMFHDLVTLNFIPDIDILPLDLHAKTEVCISVRSVMRARHTHTQNDNAKTITPVADVGCKNAQNYLQEQSKYIFFTLPLKQFLSKSMQLYYHFVGNRFRSENTLMFRC